MFLLFGCIILSIYIYFFKEILYFFILGLFVWGSIFFLTFEYAADLLAYLCLGLEENLIVHDSSD